MPRSRAHSFTDLRGAAWHSFRLLVVGLFFTVTRGAHADVARHVVLVGEPTSPLLQRLREESEALGFVVDSKAKAASTLDAELDTPGVVAAVRELGPPGEALELVIADPELRERLRETLPIRTSTDPTSKEVVVTRAIELLRAVRLHVAQTAPAPQPVELEPPVKGPVATTASSTTAVALAPLLSYAPEFNLGLSAEISVSYVPRQIGVHGGILVPLTAQRLVHEGGDITAAASAVHAAVVVRTNARLASRWQLGIGLEASRVHFEGHALPPLLNTDSNVYTFGPRFEASGSLRLAPHVRLLLPLTLSYVLPHTVVRFAGEPVRDWGPLLLRAGLGVELDVP